MITGLIEGFQQTAVCNQCGNQINNNLFPISIAYMHNLANIPENLNYSLPLKLDHNVYLLWDSVQFPFQSHSQSGNQMDTI